MSLLRYNLDYLATLLHECGVTHWAVSPGSRNAPIVAGLIRHGGFQLHSFPDERSAAFAALGMSQGRGFTCGVICTSGTASLNLYPAICEAYYQRVPLLAITADRPAELIDQWDGQVIHQKNLFEKHILASYETPQDLHERELNQELDSIVRAAVKRSLQPDKGPVHINIPLKDPIYKNSQQIFKHIPGIQPLVFLRNAFPKAIPAEIQQRLNNAKKILFLSGQNLPDAGLMMAARQVAAKFPLIEDVTANLGGVGINRIDNALHLKVPDAELAPDCLITFGLSVLSKPLKKFIQQHPPVFHLHLSTGGFTGDPFKSSPVTLACEPAEILDYLHNTLTANDNFLEQWQNYAATCASQDYSKDAEYRFVKIFLQSCKPADCIHLGNSMTVRYASLSGECNGLIFCNRGTSGIDGSLSTAVGYALAYPEKQVYCLLGDISFFYDVNGLWTDTLPTNLGIIVQNNFGGAIFNKIEGPNEVPDLMPWIATPHRRSAAAVANDYKIPFYKYRGSERTAPRVSQLSTPYICEVIYESK
jgi:2-succinyl-5-enolpyruvyl-6-hydroxy-3-cyclohexene-1-carboxylate synthase